MRQQRRRPDRGCLPLVPTGYALGNVANVDTLQEASKKCKQNKKPRQEARLPGGAGTNYVGACSLLGHLRRSARLAGLGDRHATRRDREAHRAVAATLPREAVVPRLRGRRAGASTVAIATAGNGVGAGDAGSHGFSSSI